MTKVFIVDDENIAIRRLKSLLRNFEDLSIIGSSNNADKAIREILKNEPDLIFLDIELGSQSGFDVLDSIRNQGVFSKVIFVTAYDHYAIKALREKALDYLLKPVDIDDLRNAINSYKSNNINSGLEIKIKGYSFLTKQERAVLINLDMGLTSKQIGEKMYLSPLTIDLYRRRILKKFGAKNTIELIHQINHSA